MPNTTAAHSPTQITINATPHWDPQTRQVGFPLTSTYVERCWIAVLGPTAVILLRRINETWEQELSPSFAPGQLANMVGVGSGSGRHSPLWRTITRLERFRFGQAVAPGEFNLFTEAPPLDASALGRVSRWTRTQHYQLLDAHLAALAAA